MKYICKYCGNIIKSKSALITHEKFCKQNPDNKHLYEEYKYCCICKKCNKEFIKIFKTEKEFLYLQKHDKLPKYCSRSCANTHVISNETKNKISKSIKTFNEQYPYFNIFISNKLINSLDEYKNLSKNEIQDLLKLIKNNKIYKCKYCNKSFTYIKGESFSTRYCSAECKHKYLSEHTGGYRKGSGHGKSGWYKGIYCDSSWELAFVIYHLDNNLPIARCKEQRKYVFNNKEHLYIPDFITDNGIIEIKGYKTKQWLEKEKNNPDVKVLYKDDMKFYINYAVEKYGKDFIHLYDNENKIINIFDKNISWFHKLNHDKKLYINAFVMNNSAFQYYIDNGWKIGRTTDLISNTYTNVRNKINKKIIKNIVSEKDKELYLSSLIF